jgi:hypothetical protein
MVRSSPGKTIEREIERREAGREEKIREREGEGSSAKRGGPPPSPRDTRHGEGGPAMATVEDDRGVLRQAPWLLLFLFFLPFSFFFIFSAFYLTTAVKYLIEALNQLEIL